MFSETSYDAEPQLGVIFWCTPRFRQVSPKNSDGILGPFEAMGTSEASGGEEIGTDWVLENGSVSKTHFLSS